MGVQNNLSGIDTLRSLDQLLVKQTVMASGIFSNYRANKKFTIKNRTGHNVNIFLYFFTKNIQNLYF